MITDISSGIAGTQNTTPSISTSTDKQKASSATAIEEQTAAVENRSANEEQAGSTIVTLSDGSEPEMPTYSFGGIKKGPP